MTHKICNGPAHGGESVPLPLTEEHWYFRKTGARRGTVRPPCKLCHAFKHAGGNTQVGYVDCVKVLPFVQELSARCGSPHRAAAYAGTGVSTFYKILEGGQCSLQKRTVAKIIRALDEKRREDRRNGFVHDRLIQRRRQQERVERAMNIY